MIETTGEREYAGFWVRAFASAIDDFIIMVIALGMTMAVLSLIFYWTKPAAEFGQAFTGGFIQTVDVAAIFFVQIPYFIGFHWRFGQTPGKRLLRIRVVRATDGGSLSLGRSGARYFAQGVSSLTFGVGYLVAAFHPEKKALHDLIAGTVSLVDSRNS